MTIVPIPELTDPRLEVYRNLKDTNLTRWEGLFVVEGEKLVRRLLESSYETVSVLAGDSYLPRIADILPAQVPVFTIPTRWIDELVGFQFHRGLLACGRRRPSLRVEDLLSGLSSTWTGVICPDVTDPENLGAILRISSGLGVDAVLLGERCGDPFSRRVMRVSMGATFRLPIFTSPHLAQDVALLQQAGIELAATILDPTAVPLNAFRRPGRLGILFGNEGDGLSQEWIQHAEHRLTIPMQNGTDSLNVSVAAGIFLYHLTREENFREDVSPHP